MANETPVNSSILQQFPAPDGALAERVLAGELSRSNAKVVVLDDDPTGVQTVHGVPVYTNWEEQTLQEAFAAQDRMFFILTNSRGMTAEVTEREHEKMAHAIPRRGAGVRQALYTDKPQRFHAARPLPP